MIAVDPKLIIPARAEIALRDHWLALRKTERKTEKPTSGYNRPRNNPIGPAVFAALKSGPRTSQDIADEMGVTLQRVSSTLADGKRRGKVLRIPGRQGTWKLAR